MITHVFECKVSETPVKCCLDVKLLGLEQGKARLFMAIISPDGIVLDIVRDAEGVHDYVEMKPGETTTISNLFCRAIVTEQHEIDH